MGHPGFGIWRVSQLLYDGNALEIATHLRFAATSAASDAKPKLETEAGYFESKPERMQYRDFQEARLCP